jgi:hypothetical protein
MKNYSLLPLSIKWFLAVISLLSLAMVYIEMAIVIWNNLLFLWLLIFGSPLFYFFTTPFFTLIGKYQYYSDVMFGYRTKNEIEIHLGTSFDYVFTVFPNWIKGKPIRNQIKKNFITGNLELIKKIENEEIENNIILSTTSHLINKKTFEVFKTEAVKMNLLQKIDYYWYTIDLLWMYVFSVGFKKIGRIFRVQKIQIQAKDHCLNKTIFEKALLEIESQNQTQFTISQYKKV